MANENKKRAARAGAVTLGAVLALLMTSPAAHALYRDDGDQPGEGLSVFETLGLFVIAPIASFVLIAVLVVVGEKAAVKRNSTSRNIST
ncbi:hypothetical protein [Streptomyces sp. ST2-7A]|uniref:hypothetical protein n=1 Tax=Streptomyces sp. ST2-7A TaxID=2907214 RepID=UPI001F34185B|nr:hypothetical protein [Streptomyces sp. ST2-7A]MCE7079247.1 hypothetical protein [Streptomyces sp. ST2-7A]